MNQGTAVLIFQPAEEKGIGAVEMIRGGALKNVEAIFAMHVAYILPAGYFNLQLVYIYIYRARCYEIAFNIVISSTFRGGGLQSRGVFGWLWVL